MVGATSSRAIGYEASFGAITVTSDARGGNRLLEWLTTSLGMGGVGRCTARIAGYDTQPPAPGDPVEVKLTASGSATVFTGEVLSVRPDTVGLRIVASDSLAQLARLDVATRYDDQTAGKIAEDLIGQAGAETGTIEAGPSLSSYALHPGPRALRQLNRLAELCGFDLWCDGAGKIHFAPPVSGPADHTVTWGEDLLELSLDQTPPRYDTVKVFGEGSAATDGSDKRHWLTTDLSGVSGSAGSGDATLTVQEGALRTGEDAQLVADGRSLAAETRSIMGTFKVIGSPEIEPGQRVALKGLPEGHVAAVVLSDPVRIRRVDHRLDAESGLITTVRF